MIKKKTVKELLGESLEELLKSKPFDKIRVNEIAENCGVGRRTFYNNFTDKNDLAAWLYMRQLSEFIDTRDSAELKDFILYSAEVVAKDHQILQELDKYRGQNNIRDSLTQPMVELYIKVIEKYHGCTVDRGMRLDLEFFVSGQIACVARGIHNTEIPTPQQATVFFIRCIPESLKQFL